MQHESTLVALFEGDPQGSGMRMLARSRAPELVELVRNWFAARARAEAESLAREIPTTKSESEPAAD